MVIVHERPRQHQRPKLPGKCPSPGSQEHGQQLLQKVLKVVGVEVASEEALTKGFKASGQHRRHRCSIFGLLH